MAEITGQLISELNTTVMNGTEEIPVEKSGANHKVTTQQIKEFVQQDVVKDPHYVHTDNNFTNAEKQKLAGLQQGGGNVTISKTETHYVIGSGEENIRIPIVKCNIKAAINGGHLNQAITSVEYGQPYNNQVVSNFESTLFTEVSIVMDGDDKTNEWFKNGIITIPEVIGKVVIAVTCEKKILTPLKTVGNITSNNEIQLDELQLPPGTYSLAYEGADGPLDTFRKITESVKL